MSFQETVYYQGGPVFISNERAVLGGRTYSLADVTSVTCIERPANRSGGLFVALISLVISAFLLYQISELAALNFKTSNEIALVGEFFLFLIIAGIGMVAALREHPIYIISIKSASAVSNAFASKDREYIAEIVTALNWAIAYRGYQTLPLADHLYI